MPRCRVLLVDDSPLIHEAVGTLLSVAPGVEVVGHGFSGEDGLRLSAELRPDVVVMDLAMPGMNGLEAARRLTARQGGPAVVIISVHDDLGYRDAAVDAGARAFLAKSDLAVELPSLLGRLTRPDRGAGPFGARAPSGGPPQP
ncbi:MAG: response regulator transcription factor [Isosphaeraceae bacterium]